MYRVWDDKEKCWVTNNVFLSPEGVIYTSEKDWFGKVKLIEGEPDRYIVQNPIMLNDKNETEIHEGDFLKAQIEDDTSIIGLVAYVPELAAYVILHDKTKEFFHLSGDVTEYIEIVGNVFDGLEEEYRDDEQTLQKSEV